MGPTWGRQGPHGLHVGHVNLVIWDDAGWKYVMLGGNNKSKPTILTPQKSCNSVHIQIPRIYGEALQHMHRIVVFNFPA